MSRAIKFRAWDKERKDMREVQLMDWSEWWVSTGSAWERGNALEYGERNSFRNEETDRHILMQYTGIIDRNMKRIYEGDLVIVTNDADERPIVGVIEWLHDFWNVSVVEDSLWTLKRNGYVEIIGNIYEHQHLLKEEQA